MNRALWSLPDRGGGVKDRNINSNYSTDEFKIIPSNMLIVLWKSLATLSLKSQTFSLVMSFQEASKFEATPELIFLLLRGTRVVSRRGQACLSRVTQSQSDILLQGQGSGCPSKALVS
ncbi:hypothetical protein CDAR_183531 [Caerostris darwini]|uniref:Uncharacterized protein n=1 Tax=Caerostris darwini TaxID=1538125 RepID=A0AAV4R1Y6_9ARAC|nr:hypothetical protein CDAR_183531 [Caerostris darwini]